MANEDKKEMSHPTCLLELYLETNEVAEDQTTPEEGETFLQTVGDNLNTDLVELLNKYTQGHKGLSLVHTLRAAHVMMAAQLGLVEGWLAAELQDNGVPIDPATIHAERGQHLHEGFEHAHHHLCTAHDHGDPHGDDDEDDEEPVVH